VPKYIKTLERTYDSEGTYYDLQDLEEFIDECYAEGANARTHVKLTGRLSLEIDSADSES